MQHKVTMISRQSDHPSVEFQMIKRRLREKDSTIEVVMLCKTLAGGVNSSFGIKIRYGFHIFSQMFHIATSKVVLLDTYCIPISLLHHKKGLTVIQMWHSMGTMKKFGYTTLDTWEGTEHKLAQAMRMHKNYDYVFASAETYKKDLAQGFHCDIRKIMTMPLPRLDLLQNKEYGEKMRRKIYSRYPQLKEKPLILYCPTFRKKEDRFETALYQLADKIDRENYSFVVKLHPLSKVRLTEEMIQAKEFSSFEMLFVADYVISDYSCIVYEAAVLELPLYFYNFDMDEYTGARGLAIDYEKELPGVISGKAEDIIHAIEMDSYDKERLRVFREKYIHSTTHATDDIVDFVMKFLKKNGGKR